MVECHNHPEYDGMASYGSTLSFPIQAALEMRGIRYQVYPILRPKSSSSGGHVGPLHAEDIDVRMLGPGRPFVLEVRRVEGLWNPTEAQDHQL